MLQIIYSTLHWIYIWYDSRFQRIPTYSNMIQCDSINDSTTVGRSFLPGPASQIQPHQVHPPWGQGMAEFVCIRYTWYKSCIIHHHTSSYIMIFHTRYILDIYKIHIVNIDTWSYIMIHHDTSWYLQVSDFLDKHHATSQHWKDGKEKDAAWCWKRASWEGMVKDRKGWDGMWRDGKRLERMEIWLRHTEIRCLREHCNLCNACTAC